MTTVRHDPPHRPRGPSERAGTARSKVISVIVPAKNEAASLPQLVAEIAGCAWPVPRRRLCSRLRDRGVDDGSTDETPAVLGAGGRAIRSCGRSAWRRTSGSRRRRRRASARRGATGWRRSTPTCRTTRPTWRGSGRPCPATTRPSAGGRHDAGRLVEAGDQPLGEPRSQPGPRPVDPRHGLLGPDLPARAGAPAADVPRRAPVPRPALCSARGAGSSRCRSRIGRGRTASRITTSGTVRSGWSSTSRGRLALATAGPVPGRRTIQAATSVASCDRSHAQEG